MNLIALRNVEIVKNTDSVYPFSTRSCLDTIFVHLSMKMLPTKHASCVPLCSIALRYQRLDKKSVKSVLLPVSLETEVPALLKQWPSATERSICFTAL